MMDGAKSIIALFIVVILGVFGVCAFDHINNIASASENVVYDYTHTIDEDTKNDVEKIIDNKNHDYETLIVIEDKNSDDQSISERAKELWNNKSLTDQSLFVYIEKDTQEVYVICGLNVNPQLSNEEIKDIKNTFSENFEKKEYNNGVVEGAKKIATYLANENMVASQASDAAGEESSSVTEEPTTITEEPSITEPAEITVEAEPTTTQAPTPIPMSDDSKNNIITGSIIAGSVIILVILLAIFAPFIYFMLHRKNRL